MLHRSGSSYGKSQILQRSADSEDTKDIEPGPTVDGDPFVDVHILGRRHDGLETTLDQCSLDERLT